MENRYIEAVKTFHRTFGHPIGDNMETPDSELTSLRYNLLQEEVAELATALIHKNGLEVLDALVDIQYILSGTVVAFGLQEMFDECFEEVHSSNMSKLGADGKPIYREDGKVLKGPNYFKPNLKKIIKRHRDASTKQKRIDLD
jgi:predicted HAD superfamily Cof-like phosphohydrolase